MALDPIIRGDYEIIEFTVTEPDPANPGEERVRDITNDALTFTAKRRKQDPTPFIQKTMGQGITKTNAANGKGEIEILPADTIGITRETPLTCDIQGVAPVNKPYSTLFSLQVMLDVSS